MANYRVLELTGSKTELEIAIALLADEGCLGFSEFEGSQLAYFPESRDLTALVDELALRFPALMCRESARLPERDWLAEWKENLTGFTLGEQYFVMPTWRPEVDTPRTTLRIDPEQAFGIGTHETTRLSVSLLERHVAPGCSVIDVGTGTGILAMVAAHEGASAIAAIEPDADAVACARANVERNGLRNKIQIECQSWEDRRDISADVVVANIDAGILRHAVHRMKGTLILSGLLIEDLDEFIEELPERFRVCEEWSSGEWAALVLR